MADTISAQLTLDASVPGHARSGRTTATTTRPGRSTTAASTGRPALIVRRRGAADVIDAVTYAQETGLPLSVRCGGHGVAGTSAGRGRRAGRPVGDEGRARRPGARAPAIAQGGRAVGRVRPGRRAVRARHPGRPGHHDRGRRVLPRRRLRLALPGVRPDLRQPGRRRRGDRRRPAGAGQRGREQPTCSGACAAPARTSASSRPTSCACTRCRRRCSPAC